MKYKLLCRWAHHTLTADTFEKISAEATFLYSKLEFNLEQAMSRHDRLSQPDFYEVAKSGESRPTTKKDEGQSSLYVENVEIDPQSMIREDDIEVYIRGTTYKNKINKTTNKLISHLKWVPMRDKSKIFAASVASMNSLKTQSVKRQQKMADRV